MARDDLFATPAETKPAESPAPEFPRRQPLAARMRPRGLNEFVGQSHILGPGQLLRRAIEADRIQSLIFYGPPGTGKTSLAQIIARQTKSKFERLSGVESNVADMRRVLASAANRLENKGQPTILFVDEIHRFNKSQQDVLLPDVESGVVQLIGATTHNPFFFVNSPLVSRSQIFELRSLTEEDLYSLLQRALKDEERGLGLLKIKADEAAIRHLAKLSDGDARKALNSLEIAALTTAPEPDGVIPITLTVAEQSIQKKAIVYDDEDAHYDTISAFIKSMRGSDPDAALYWLAKMVHAGEDPRFIARRIVIHAAEDVGLADPMALVLANAAFQAAEFIGWPEAQIPLAEATIYIATAPKSNSTVMAIGAAMKDVESGRTLPVPEHLRDSHYKGAKRLGHGVGYEYAHDHPEHFVVQDYLGAEKRYYEPTDQGVEKKIKERVEKWRAMIAQSKAQGPKSKRLTWIRFRKCPKNFNFLVADYDFLQVAKQSILPELGDSSDSVRYDAPHIFIWIHVDKNEVCVIIFVKIHTTILRPAGKRIFDLGKILQHCAPDFFKSFPESETPDTAPRNFEDFLRFYAEGLRQYCEPLLRMDLKQLEEISQKP